MREEAANTRMSAKLWAVVGQACLMALAVQFACSSHPSAEDAPANGADVVVGHPECATCVAPSPYCVGTAANKWVCVGCVGDADCAPHGLGTCLRPQHQCSGIGTLAPDCAVCKGDTPACFYMGQQWYCAGCLTDSDCALTYQGTCRPDAYTCTIARPGCKVDSDCRQRSDSAYDLACDVTHNFCYDKQGRCDDLTAYCAAETGARCELPASLTPTGARHCTCGSNVANFACPSTTTTGGSDCSGGLACACDGTSAGAPAYCGL